MSITQWCAALTIAGLSVMALSGCVPQSVADGEVAWSDSWEASDDGSMPAFWEEPDRLIVILGGSSSCPSVVTKVDESEGLVPLTVERAGGPACTADMVIAPTLFTLEMGRPAHVVMRYGSEEHVLDVVDAEG